MWKIKIWERECKFKKKKKTHNKTEGKYTTKQTVLNSANGYQLMWKIIIFRLSLTYQVTDFISKQKQMKTKPEKLG